MAATRRRYSSASASSTPPSRLVMNAQVIGEERAHSLRVGVTERLDQLPRDAFGDLRRRHGSA